MRRSIVVAIKQNESTYEFVYGHSAFGFVGRRGLDQGAFTIKHGVKFCRLQYLVDLDCLGGALKFASVLFAFFLQPSLIAREQGDSSVTTYSAFEAAAVEVDALTWAFDASSVAEAADFPARLAGGLRFELIFELR